MKILIIRTFPDILQLDSYNVQEIGLAKALVKRGHTCDIVLFNGRNKSRQKQYCFEDETGSYSFTIYWMRGVAFMKNGFMPGVKKIISRYDVVQVHEYDQLMSWQLYTKAIKPTVLYHGPYYHPYARGYHLKCRVFDRMFLPMRKYQQVTAMTKSRLAADFLKEKGFVHVIPVGVGIDVDNLGKQTVIETDTPDKEAGVRLLYVGKIEERRNVYFLIEVFRQLKKRYSNLQLYLIGDGEQEYKEAFLRSLKEEIDRGEIVYMEKLSQKELPAYYRKADVFLFTSNYDIFGMVLLEAMYYGLPVVSSLNGGSSTLIKNGENGYVLDTFDLRTWTEKIAQLIENGEDRNTMGKKAAETVKQGYTWDVMAEKFEQVYREAVKSRE